MPENYWNKIIPYLIIVVCYQSGYGKATYYSAVDSSAYYNDKASELLSIKPVLAQTYVDKAQAYATLSNNPLEQVRATIYAGNLAYDRLEYQKAKNLFEDALQHAESHGLHELHVDAALHLVRWHKYRSRDYDSAIKYAYESLKIGKAQNFALGQARSYVRLADLNAKQKNIEEALHYLELSVAPYKEIDLEIDIAHHYNQVGKQIWEYDNSKAIEVYRKGLEYYDGYPDLQLSMGRAYLHIGKTLDAKNYFTDALESYHNTNEFRKQGMALSFLSEVLIEFDQIEKADSLAEECIKLIRPLSPRQQSGLPRAYRAKGKVYQSKGAYASALEAYTKSLTMCVRLEEFDELAESHLLVGLLQLNHLGAPDLAISSCQISRRLSKEKNLVNREMESCECLYKSYREKEDFENALYSYKDYQDLKDSTDLIEFKQSIDSLSAFFITKSNLELKDQELSTQKLENRLYGFIIFIGLIFIYYLYNSIRKLVDKNRIIKSQNKEIQEKTENLAELNATKTKILAVIGHDIKGPLRTLRSFLDLLIGERLTKESFLDIAVGLRNNTTAVFETLDNLLNWAKLEMSGTVPQLEPVSILNEAQKVEQLLRPTITQKKINLTISVPENLSVSATESGIILVIRNLVSNAIKFTETGGNIRIYAQEDQNEVRVYIEDDGIGIEEAILPTIFNSGESTYGTNNEQGTGIGLSLCKGIIEQFGGSIKAENNDNKGSRFSFSLPNPS